MATVLYSHEALYVEDEQDDAGARAVLVLLFSCTIGCAVLGYGARWIELEPESEPGVQRSVYLMACCWWLRSLCARP